ncbi:MAG TPA: bifunctional 5,10-methylenetetrahydrofolate dehydrogenase/5,10-methenyltetrahydrofolate cyclohydrolase [Candidatus Paceibacterota bacterium]
MFINGRKIADDIAGEISGQIVNRALKIKLMVVQVGSDKATESFVRAKKKFAERVGIDIEFVQMSMDDSTNDLKEIVSDAGLNKNISGVIVQLPLPDTFETNEILDLIPPNKDPDILSSSARALFVSGKSPILPPVVGAIEQIVNDYDIDLFEADIAIVGYGKLVGEPVATWLRNLGVEYTVVTSDNTDPGKILRSANLIISGVGKPGLIKSSMLSDDVVVIDAGTSESPDIPAGERSGLVGDCDPACYNKARLITPVPGGVGPIAVAMLFRNLLILSS